MRLEEGAIDTIVTAEGSTPTAAATAAGRAAATAALGAVPRPEMRKRASTKLAADDPLAVGDGVEAGERVDEAVTEMDEVALGLAPVDREGGGVADGVGVTVADGVGVPVAVAEALAPATKVEDGVFMTVGEADGVALGDTKLPVRSTAVDEQASREMTVAVRPLARIAGGMGKRPKAAANATSLRPAAPEALRAIMDAAKLLSRNCTAEARVGTSMFKPSGPVHSKVSVGNEEGADGLGTESDTMRALDMPVTLTMRKSASAWTAS